MTNHLNYDLGVLQDHLHGDIGSEQGIEQGIQCDITTDISYNQFYGLMGYLLSGQFKSNPGPWLTMLTPLSRGLLVKILMFCWSNHKLRCFHHKIHKIIFSIVKRTSSVCPKMPKKWVERMLNTQKNMDATMWRPLVSWFVNLTKVISTI